MPYQGKKQQQAPEEHKNARPEEQFVPEQRTFGMPNSLMQAVPMAQPGTPNSVMREMDADDSGALFRGRGFDPSIGAHELSHTVRREPANGPVRQTVPSGTIQRVGGVDDEDDFRRISEGEINASQLEKDRALWAQMKKSREKGGSDALKRVIAANKARAEADKKGRAAMNMSHGTDIGGSKKLDLSRATSSYVNGSVYRGEEEEEPGLFGKIKRIFGIGR